MRVIRCKNSVTAIFSDGRIIQSDCCTDQMFEKLREYQKVDNEFEAINVLIPEDPDDTMQRIRVIQFLSNVEKSSCLSFDNDAVYWKEVSPLSMPMGLAEKVIDAEKKNNAILLSSYKNFWRLLSLNQDPDVRKNLFLFLDKWGMVITKSGLFVGYRNVDTKERAEDLKDSVFTDNYTGTMKIKIGQMVTLPRSECDNDSTRECSRGLIVAHLGSNSFGK